MFFMVRFLSICCSYSPGRLLPRAAVEEEIADNEYLGAAMRLTSELARYAITQVRRSLLVIKSAEENKDICQV